MRLRFPEKKIPKLCERYSYTRGEQELLDLHKDISKAGCISKDQLQKIALWKSPRSAGRVERNDPDFVREISSFAFSAKNERSRIETLTLLNGVQWPTASVILHFFHSDPYPILDFRALWSVGTDVPNQYTFGFWWPFVEFCRITASRNSVDMRTFDQALWQFSKENQSTEEPPNRAGKSRSLAEEIRVFVADTAIRPELASGTREIRVRAGDIHSAMKLNQRMPSVCSALESQLLADTCGVEIIHREGPIKGANAIFVFRSRIPQEGRIPTTKNIPKKRQIQQKPKNRRDLKNVKGTIYLVSCVSQKRAASSIAKDLYISDWFSKARAYAEMSGFPWLILSAKYGLVSPDEIIKPYELTLNKMAIADRRHWAKQVLEQLEAQLSTPKRIVMLAGARYREFVEPELRAMGIDIDVPMEGLRIGEQLSWLGHQTQDV